MNDAEIRAKVDVGDGGSFVRLGKNISRCDKQAEYLKVKIDETRNSIKEMQKATDKPLFVGGTKSLKKILEGSKQLSLQKENLFAGQKIDVDLKGSKLLRLRTDYSKQILREQAQLEKLENQYNKLQMKQEETSAGLTKGMEKGIKSFKRFGFALFGIHSIWRMVSRASSAYLQQDTETANKIRTAWVGLGAFLAPALEKISVLTIKAVKYLNVFITALTGVDFLSRAIAKSMNKLTGSANKANKALAPFDELSNIAEDNADSTADWVEAFNSIEINPKIAETIEKIGKFLRPVYKMVKNIFDNWDKYEEYILAVGGALTAVFIGSKIATILTNIGLVATSLGGLLTLATITVTLAIVGWKEVKTRANEVKESLQGVVDTEKDLTQKEKDLAEVTLKKAKANELSNDQLKYSIDYHLRLIEKNQELNKESENQTSILGALFGWNKKIREAQDERNNTNIEAIRLLKEMNSLGLLDEKNKEKLIKLIEIEKDKYDKLSNSLGLGKDKQEEYRKKAEELRKELEDLTGKKYSTEATVEVKAETKKAKNTIWSFFSGLGSDVLNFFGLGGILNKLASLDVGTNYVPQDQLAYIHKGEAIIPKKFNAPEYFGKIGNEDVLAKLDKLIETIEEKDMNAYISSKAIGNVSIAYQNQQKRIMGW